MTEEWKRLLLLKDWLSIFGPLIRVDLNQHSISLAIECGVVDQVCCRVVRRTLLCRWQDWVGERQRGASKERLNNDQKRVKERVLLGRSVLGAAQRAAGRAQRERERKAAAALGSTGARA